MLQEPFKLGSLLLSNRLAKAPLSEKLAERSGAPGAPLLRLHQRWAHAGVGLSVSGHAMIDPNAVAERGNLIITRANLSALKTLATTMQAGGSAGFVQLNHPGRQTMRGINAEAVAPSAVPMRGMFGAFAKPRAIREPEIHALIERWAEAALLVKEAGFAGVQVHAAHGYLISQFLSPHSNRRDDAWGGDLARRARILREVVRSVRAAVGPSYPISVKLNSADFQRGGFQEADSLEVVQMLEAEGIDLLEISGGTYESGALVQEHGSRASTLAREAFYMVYAEQVRARSKLPLMLSGGFRSRAAMEHALRTNAVDLIGLGRPLIVDPDFGQRLLRGDVDRAPAIALATGIKTLDTFMQGAWYQAQMRRMGRGDEPTLALSRWVAALRFLFPESLTPNPRREKVRLLRVTGIDRPVVEADARGVLGTPEP